MAYHYGRTGWKLFPHSDSSMKPHLTLRRIRCKTSPVSAGAPPFNGSLPFRPYAPAMWPAPVLHGGRVPYKRVRVLKREGAGERDTAK